MKQTNQICYHQFNQLRADVAARSCTSLYCGEPLYTIKGHFAKSHLAVDQYNVTGWLILRSSFVVKILYVSDKTTTAAASTC